MIRHVRFTTLALLLLIGRSISQAAPTFTSEGGTQISSAVPQAIIGTAPSYRMYYLSSLFDVKSATSTDGVNWGIEDGIRLSTGTLPERTGVQEITGCTLVPLDGGGYKMLYSVRFSTGAFEILVATSSDGVNFANSTITAVTAISTATFLGSPRLLELSNGDWRLYYTQDANGGENIQDRRVFTRLSDDEGVTWSTGTVAFSDRIGEIAVSTLTNGNARLYYTAPVSGSNINSEIRSAIAEPNDFDSFAAETGIRLSTANTAGSLSFPVVVRSSETYRWRLHFGFIPTNSTNTFIQSALTLTPNPQGLTPSSVALTDAPATFTINGEIFSPTPTVALARTGEADVAGTSVSRTDDATITFTFDPSLLVKEYWNLEVTNSDGVTGIGTNLLFVTFASGEIHLVDNVLRPRSGNSTQINVTIYDAGKVELKLYTLDGRLIQTFLDEDRAAGPFTIPWNGTNSNGEPVASGTYLLKALGPKLDKVEKIVIIR